MGEEQEIRFSDQKLNEFYDDFKAHRERCERRFEECDNLVIDLIEMQKANAETIRQLTEETREVVQLHKDFQGAARIGTSIQRLVLWFGKWGALGVGIATAMTWGADKLVEVFK